MRVPEAQNSLLKEVEHSARGAHCEVGATAQLQDLSRLVDPSDEQRGSDPDSFAQFGGHGGALLGEFSGGAEHEGLDRDPLGIELADHRSREGESLPRPRFGFPDEVFAFEYDRDRTRLDWGRSDESELFEAGEDVLWESEVTKEWQL